MLAMSGVRRVGRRRRHGRIGRRSRHGDIRLVVDVLLSRLLQAVALVGGLLVGLRRPSL